MKIVGNMIELKSPTAMMLHFATDPWVAMLITTSATAARACAASTLPGFHSRSVNVPMNRPIIAPPQYSETSCAPAASVNPPIAGSLK